MNVNFMRFSVKDLSLAVSSWNLKSCARGGLNYLVDERKTNFAQELVLEEWLDWIIGTTLCPQLIPECVLSFV